MPNGKIQPEFVETLKIIGDWTSKNGESIFGTRGGPVPPQTWGVTTQKDNSVFVHILDWKSNSFLLPNFSGAIKKMVDFSTKKPLDYESTSFGTLIQLPDDWNGAVDYIIEISVK